MMALPLRRTRQLDLENPRTVPGIEQWLVRRGWTLRWQADGSLKVTLGEKGLVVDESTTLRTLTSAMEAVREYEAEELRWGGQW